MDSTAFEAMADNLAQQLDAFEKETGERPGALARDVLLRKLYETAYRIFNHYGNDVPPLAMYAARQKEEIFLYSKQAIDMERFIDLGVYQVTGTSWEAWQNMPVPEAELMIQLTIRKNRSETQSTGQIEKKLQAALEAARQDAAKKEKDKP